MSYNTFEFWIIFLPLECYNTFEFWIIFLPLECSNSALVLTEGVNLMIVMGGSLSTRDHVPVPLLLPARPPVPMTARFMAASPSDSLRHGAALLVISYVRWKLRVLSWDLGDSRSYESVGPQTYNAR
jgi:hypothetical protein